jgi:hypothetical protein
MRYPASEKLEIIRLVEQSHLPVRRVLEQIGIPRSTFYRWCEFIRLEGQRGWTIAALGLIGCGTASPMTSARGSSHWPSTSRSSRPVNWPCALPMPSAWRDHRREHPQRHVRKAGLGAERPRRRVLSVDLDPDRPSRHHDGLDQPRRLRQRPGQDREARRHQASARGSLARSVGL